MLLNNMETIKLINVSKTCTTIHNKSKQSSTRDSNVIYLKIEKMNKNQHLPQPNYKLVFKKQVILKDYT